MNSCMSLHKTVVLGRCSCGDDRQTLQSEAEPESEPEADIITMELTQQCSGRDGAQRLVAHDLGPIRKRWTTKGLTL